jgi:phage shock protein A
VQPMPCGARQQGAAMADPDHPDPRFDAMTARLLQREALRRAAEELNTTSGPGLEGVLARISAEVTADAASRVAATRATVHGAGPIVDHQSGTAPSDRAADRS